MKAVGISIPQISGSDFIESAKASTQYEINNAEQGLVYAWTVLGAEDFESEVQTHVAVNWDVDVESGGVFVVATDTITGAAREANFR